MFEIFNHKKINSKKGFESFRFFIFLWSFKVKTFLDFFIEDRKKGLNIMEVGNMREKEKAKEEKRRRKRQRGRREGGRET